MELRGEGDKKLTFSEGLSIHLLLLLAHNDEDSCPVHDRDRGKWYCEARGP